MVCLAPDIESHACIHCCHCYFCPAGCRLAAYGQQLDSNLPDRNQSLRSAQKSLQHWLLPAVQHLAVLHPHPGYTLAFTAATFCLPAAGRSKRFAVNLLTVDIEEP
jgi:hypothetical protein